jgi:TonB family protein
VNQVMTGTRASRSSILWLSFTRGRLRRPARVLAAAWLVAAFSGWAMAQSNPAGGRPSGRAYGVNLTFAVYQYDANRSPSIDDVLRLGATFTTAEDEIAYLKDKYKLEEVEVRHIRSVGLRSGETFNDAVLLGPEYMVFSVTPSDVIRGHMKLDMLVRYANQPLLELKETAFGNFETLAFRGGKGTFGIKYFIGAGGRQESAAMERTLLVSVTPEIVPLSNLRNLPAELSHPVDEYGGAIDLRESDRFTPPVALERVVPTFQAAGGFHGSVLLTGVVTGEGKITNIQVLRGLDPVIDDRAIEAFRKFSFSPALLNGKPVSATYREELTFPRQATFSEVQAEMDKLRKKEKEKAKKP